MGYSPFASDGGWWRGGWRRDFGLLPISVLSRAAVDLKWNRMLAVPINERVAGTIRL
jgi:hypothetical protein